MTTLTIVITTFLAYGLGQEAEPKAGEGEQSPGSIEKLVETMRSSPALSTEERLKRAASVASGVIRPLPVVLAIIVTVAGLVMMLFGQRLLRFGIVIYLMALGAFAGREIGARMGEGWESFIGGILGGAVGAGLAVPLRALARSVIGGLAGGILVAMVMQTFTSSMLVTLLSALGGVIVSGVLTLFFPRPLMMVGFALFGAAAASIGILSIATEPVEGFIAYSSAHITGLLVAAALGVLFQTQLGKADETDESE